MLESVPTVIIEKDGEEVHRFGMVLIRDEYTLMHSMN